MSPWGGGGEKTPTCTTTTRGGILLVDDDAGARSALARLLALEGYAVEAAASGAAALDAAAAHPPDIVVTDLTMPGMDGLQLVARLHEVQPDLPVLVASGHADLESVVAAMRGGADDYVAKPVDFEVLALAIARSLERRHARTDAESLRRHLRERDGEGLQGLIGGSAPMRQVYAVARRIAVSRSTVLLTGESGTGKGELARAIHALGPRADKPFVSVHCAAVPETLLESELFGHEKGAFTGADRRRIGRFEQANGGTLFLDEVGEIPASKQVKLLRILQERVLERVGGNESIPTDVRVIAATNRDLAADVQAGRMREDLYYRLNVVRLEMPPLRTRGADTMVLANHFLRRFAAENHKKVEGFDRDAEAWLAAQTWPGNVRALENAVERAVVLAHGPLVGVRDIEDDDATSSCTVRIPGARLDAIERYAITKTLEACDGSTKRAVELLGISIRTIQYRIHQYGLARDGAAPGPRVVRPPSGRSS